MEELPVTLYITINDGNINKPTSVGNGGLKDHVCKLYILQNRKNTNRYLRLYGYGFLLLYVDYYNMGNKDE